MQIVQLGPYRVGKPIGKGGMGSVYEATDVQSGRQVAIKALNPYLAQIEGFRERFEAEIESLKTLRHDGIVRLFGFGEQDGILFYSMERIHGTSLEDELRAGRRFDWREVVEIAVQLCLALKHAHDHGVIHRDIKPANVLIAENERVKLADFGIARLFGSSSSLTTAGGVLGTADYMSPEQADGRPVTSRCDQYSLGGVMYALLAGRPPFRANSLPEMLQMQRFAQPEPVSRYAEQTPKQLEQLITQLLSKDPADRFPNTQVLARHLQAMARALSRPAHDSFALASDPTDPNLVDAGLNESLALAVTQAEADARPPLSVATPPAQEANKAPPEPPSDPQALVADVVSPTPESSPENAAEKSVVNASPGESSPPAAAATFTTLEEDDARRRQQQARSWLAILAPLLGLAFALAAVACLALYLSRPSTADQLYAKISPRADSNDIDSIRDVEREIDEFLARFPDDERATELRQYQQRIELDRMHRRLQLQARRGGVWDPALLPVEMLYLEAMNAAADSTEKSIEMLEALIALYGTDLPEDVAESTADPASSAARKKQPNDDQRRGQCVQLARHQIGLLRTEFAKQTERQLAAVRERIAAAENVATSDPEQARTMYRAIIRLYGDKVWAQPIVTEARQRLEQDKETSRQRD